MAGLGIRRRAYAKHVLADLAGSELTSLAGPVLLLTFAVHVSGCRADTC